MELSERSSNDDAEKPTTTKKLPYQRPVLIRFGTLSDITLAVSNSGNPDGKGKNRTGRGGRFDGAGVALKK